MGGVLLLLFSARRAVDAAAIGDNNEDFDDDDDGVDGPHRALAGVCSAGPPGPPCPTILGSPS